MKKKKIIKSKKYVKYHKFSGRFIFIYTLSRKEHRKRSPVYNCSFRFKPFVVKKQRKS